MSRAQGLLGRLNEADEIFVEEYRKLFIFKWNNANYVVATKESDKDRVYIDSLGYPIKGSGLLHSDDFKGMKYPTLSAAKVAADKYWKQVGE